jgi:hypothetical protein
MGDHADGTEYDGAVVFPSYSGGKGRSGFHGGRGIAHDVYF